MAIDFDLNLFTSDPRLLSRGDDAEYERAAAALDLLADPDRLRLLHALALGEDTPQRAAVWSGLPQPLASATYNAANHQLTFGSQTLTYDLNGKLRGVRVGVQGVDCFHGRTLQSSCASSSSCGVSTGRGCVPTLSSQIEMIGTNFEKSRYRKAIAAKVAIVIMISTGCGR